MAEEKVQWDEEVQWDQPAAPSREKGIVDRAKDVATSAGFGAAAGAFTPEIAFGTGQLLEKVPVKPVQMAGRAMKAAAPGMTGAKQRAIGSLAGGFSGATGETAGQVAELAGAPAPVAESARILGSLAPIEVLTTGARGVSGLMRSVSPTAANTRMLLQSVMDDVGAANLAGAKREEVMRRINELRQAPFTTDAQKKLYDVLARDVQTMTGAAAKEAQALQQAGTREGLEAQRRARGFAGMGGEVAETKTAILQGAKDALRNVGDETRELSDVGRTLRDTIVSRFDEQSLARSKAYLDQKAIRDDVVRKKESSGVLVNSLPEFKAMIDDLRSKLLIGQEARQQVTAPVTEKGLLNAYKNIYKAVVGRKVAYVDKVSGDLKEKTYPSSFEALDAVRRKLGDIAFGKEVAGYEGLTREVAQKYYAKLSEIQSKYAGPAQDTLQKDYEIASRLLDKFQTKGGAKATAMDRIDANKFKTDEKSLPNVFFNSKQSVADTIELVGDAALVEREAADYVARSLAGKSASSAKTWITSKQNSDWLSALPNVRKAAQNYVTNLERAEARAAGATKVESRLGAQERQAVREAEKAPELGAKEAAKVTEQAQAEAARILGTAEPARRIKQILMSEDATLWHRIAPAIAAAPRGREILGESVRQALADRAEQGIFSTMRFYEESLMDSLTRTGLLGRKEADQILRQLKEIASVSISEPEKLTFMGRLIKNAIVGYAVPRAGTGTVNTLGDVINQRGQINSAAPNLGAR